MNTHTLHDTAVLVVDDELETCKLMVHLLRKLEYTAEFLNTGPEAIEYLEEYAVPTLIFLDVLMPDMGGLEVLEALKANPSTRGVPVIIYSALIDSKLRSEALRLGACDFMPKGRISLGDLRALVERNVGGRSNTCGFAEGEPGRVNGLGVSLRSPSPLQTGDGLPSSLLSPKTIRRALWTFSPKW